MNEFSFIRNVTSIVIHNPSLVEITQSDAELFNSLPETEVVPALLEIFENATDSAVKSRAFDALLKLKTFDKVEFLIHLFDRSTDGWRAACCMELAKFPDRRAIVKLCDVLLHHDDPDLRYIAAESLAHIGDATAIEPLEQAKANDSGTDYEGFPISAMANQALQKVFDRLSEH